MFFKALNIRETEIEIGGDSGDEEYNKNPVHLF
jgi:hypothetical protein